MGGVVNKTWIGSLVCCQVCEGTLVRIPIINSTRIYKATPNEHAKQKLVTCDFLRILLGQVDIISDVTSRLPR